MSARRETDPYGDLLRELTQTIVVQIGTREEIARQYAEAAMHCLQDRKAANGNVYVGAPPRQYDLLQIRASLERGDGIAKVCRDFGLSRTQLFRLFPGGLYAAIWPQSQTSLKSGTQGKTGS